MDSSWKTKLLNSKKYLFLIILLHGVIGWLCYSNFVKTTTIVHFPIFYEQGLTANDVHKRCHPTAANSTAIAYSVYGSDTSYWQHFPEIFKDIKTIYSGWLVFIYADDHLCGTVEKLVSGLDYVNLCCVSLVKENGVFLTEFVPTTWRFYLMGHPNVDVIVFRDSDSKITEREFSAVEDWLQNSNATLHGMRDHPYHVFPLMAGMFGLRQNERNRDQIRDIRDKMFSAGRGRLEKAQDQALLSKYLLPSFRDDVYFHDSYRCEKFEHTFPFPTQRVNGSFVGAQAYRSNKPYTVNKTCPVICRPKNHLDWEYC